MFTATMLFQMLAEADPLALTGYLNGIGKAQMDMLEAKLKNQKQEHTLGVLESSFALLDKFKVEFDERQARSKIYREKSSTQSELHHAADQDQTR